MKYRVEITETADAAYIVEADSHENAEAIAVSDHEGPRRFRVWFDSGEREARVNQPARKRAGDAKPGDQASALKDAIEFAAGAGFDPALAESARRQLKALFA